MLLLPGTMKRCRVSSSWYSFTRSVGVLSFFFFFPAPFLLRKILLRGISTTMPMAMQMMPTGKKEKKASFS